MAIDSAIPPQVAIGGRLAAVQMVSQAPGAPRVNQVPRSCPKLALNRDLRYPCV